MTAAPPAPAKPRPEGKAGDYMARHDAMWGELELWKTLWDKLAVLVMPRKSEVLERTTSPDTAKHERLFDGTMISANQILANGQASLVIPANERWFEFEPPGALRNDPEAARWMQECTEITLEAFGTSNFYTAAQECLLDRSGMGTCCLFVKEAAGQLVFRPLPIGSYAIAEDPDGNADTVHREFKFTAKQAVERFGEKALPASIQRAYNNPGECNTTQFEFIQIVAPRRQRDSRRIDNANMPIESVYLAKKDSVIVEESGFEEMPLIVSRYLEWTSGGDRHPYGWCPAWLVVADGRQLNKHEEIMDLMAELMVQPPVLTPANLDGAVDFSPLGETVFDPNKPNAKPELWNMNGVRYDVGKDRAEDKRQRIRDAFHVDLFQMFQQIDREMTAHEVRAREAEKLMQFSPAFTRLSSEFLNPLLRRVFGVLFRAGAFPKVPESMLVRGRDGVFLPDPKTVYHNAITLAQRQQENAATYEIIEAALGMAEIDPSALDAFNVPQMMMGLARNRGVPSAFLNDPDTMAQLAQARQEQQEQQAMLAMAAQAAEGASKLGVGREDLAEVV